MKKVEIYLAGRKTNVLVFAKEKDTQYCAAHSWVGKVVGVDIIGGTNVADIGDVRNFLVYAFPEWENEMVSLALDAIMPICCPPAPKRNIEVFF